MYVCNILIYFQLHKQTLKSQCAARGDNSGVCDRLVPGTNGHPMQFMQRANPAIRYGRMVVDMPANELAGWFACDRDQLGCRKNNWNKNKTQYFCILIHTSCDYRQFRRRTAIAAFYIHVKCMLHFGSRNECASISHSSSAHADIYIYIIQCA